MFIKNLNLERELVLMSHGRKTHIPSDILAGWALAAVRGGLPAPVHNNELQWLERLGRLEDTRHA